MRRLALSAALAVGFIAALAVKLAAPADAMPLARGPAVAETSTQAPVELVHGCHRGVQRDYSGWHFHDRACVRRNTAPPGLYDNPSYRRYYRGPLCTYRCRHVGPVKTCSQVCR